MIRARAWLAGKLVALARVIVPDDVEDDADAPRDDEDEGLPMGCPVVVRSAEAERMIREGAALATMQRLARSVEVKPEAPLAGSLRDRVARARNA